MSLTRYTRPGPDQLPVCRRRVIIGSLHVLLSLILSSGVAWPQGTVAVEEAPAPLSPAEALGSFTVAESLEIGLVVSEPEISQPLSISFDDRNRMWVLQYVQFPNPNGLQPVEVDHWLRTKYDRLPEPPPRGPRGRDRISICEDRDGDGRVDAIRHFLTDLNLASGMVPGHGGVFVVQPPYLLFYPDRDANDVPDGDPEVLLSGFGMDDAHAFANSLTWGPDGWLYGAQGSTATAEIRGIGFQQGVWRYHPITKEFELFAEGGGNTWGIDFDQFGNLFAGGNTVEPLVHHVQGAYYVKGFGKHGPLHNPHAYGYFPPVLHHGYMGDSLTGGFVIYQGGAFPDPFSGACIAPNTRHSACRWSTLETRGSTFATRAAGDFVTSSDIWFRPVDSTVGPDGALYLADWYDYNISHSSPKNRSEWYQPSRDDGRIWRVAPGTTAAIRSGGFDLSRLSSEGLIELLRHPNDWYARQARRILAERRDPSIVPALRPLLNDSSQRTALQALWSIFVSDGLDDQLAVECLRSPHEYVRAWTVRLLGDRRRLPPQLQPIVVELAEHDDSVIVRSQLACTARRLPAVISLPIIARLLRHDLDSRDPHIPLLLWWAVEDKTVSDTDLVLELVTDARDWQRPLLREFLIPRLARRLAAEFTDTGFAACARLLRMASADSDADLVISGMTDALAGQTRRHVPGVFTEVVREHRRRRPGDARLLELSIRTGQDILEAIHFVGDTGRPAPDRQRLIMALGEIRTPEAVGTLSRLLDAAEPESIQTAALSALGAFDEQQVAAAILGAWPGLCPASQERALIVLCSRASWTRELLDAIGNKAIDPGRISTAQVQQLFQHADAEVQRAAAEIWGRVRAATPLEKQGRISAVSQLLARGAGDPRRGLPVFEKTCANCHRLHGLGRQLGPDLTGAERRDSLKLVQNIVDPDAVIRPEFITHVAVTRTGQVLSGLLAASTGDTITLLDAKNNRSVLRRADLEELNESTVSLMPDKILDELTDQQIRDLFAFVQSEQPVEGDHP